MVEKAPSEPVPFAEIWDRLNFIPKDRSYGQVLQGRGMRGKDGQDFVRNGDILAGDVFG